MNPRRLAALAATTLIVPAPALAGTGNTSDASAGPTALAVIGDTPYGPVQADAFPAFVERINEDPKVRAVLHVGDIKNGSSACSDEYFARIRRDFDAFADPLVYTPGDNEWTDCHRPAAGGYVPTERLDALRDVFFSEPGVTLGARARRVEWQESLVENVLWVDSRVVFATVHVVGSNNGLAPWFGGLETPAQASERMAEVEARDTANVAWIDAAFDRAEWEGAAGVVLAMQADMWDGQAVQQTGFAATKEAIERRAGEFGRPVLLLEGDSHRYLVDQPFAAAPNVTRVVVEGENVGEYLKLTIDPREERLFSWSRKRG